MRRLSKAGFPVFLFVVFFTLGACGRGGYGAASFNGRFASVGEAAAAPAMGSGVTAQFESDAEFAADLAESPSLSETNAGQSRKLIKRAELRLRVEDPGAAEKPLAELMQKYGAWPASTGVYENSRNYSIRVPSASYDAMLTEMLSLGRMVGRTESAEDVTLRYYDLEGRLATREELLVTYRGYLSKAANIDEIMSVESRIADLQYEIDRMGTQFRNLANLVDYSTIDVEILGPVSVSSYSTPGLGEKLDELFGSFGDVVSQALVVLVGIVVYGIPAVLLFILLFSLFFGRIGLLKKIWRFAVEKKVRKSEGHSANREKRSAENPSENKTAPESAE